MRRRDYQFEVRVAPDAPFAAWVAMGRGGPVPALPLPVLDVYGEKDNLAVLESARLETLVSDQSLDISLPGLDGNEVLRQIRADDALQALPVIALTADAMSGDKERYLALGMDDYVAKPIDQRELITKIVTLLEQRKPPGGASGVPLRWNIR